MNYMEWKQNISKIYLEHNILKSKRFNLKPIEANDDIDYLLIKNNIFSVQGIENLKYSIQNDNIINVIVGGSANELHLGHIIIIKEIVMYYSLYSNVNIHFITNSNNYNFIYSFIQLLEKQIGRNIYYRIVDKYEKKWLEFKELIYNNISVKNINRILGWKDNNLKNYDEVVNMIATLLYNNIINENNTIVLTDINQAVYYELAKNIIKKLQLINPMLSYHLLLPSLLSPINRMSVKKINSRINFYDESEILFNKLLKSYTGSEDKEFSCSFLRILDLFLDDCCIEEIIPNCYNNKCYLCKEKNSQLIIKALQWYR